MEKCCGQLLGPVLGGGKGRTWLGWLLLQKMEGNPKHIFKSLEPVNPLFPFMVKRTLQMLLAYRSWGFLDHPGGLGDDKGPLGDMDGSHRMQIPPKWGGV